MNGLTEISRLDTPDTSDEYYSPATANTKTPSVQLVLRSSLSSSISGDSPDIVAMTRVAMLGIEK